MALVRSPSVEFVDLMLTIEGGRPSAQSFSLLFDLVSDGSLVSAHSSGLDFLHVFFEMSKRVNYKTQVSLIRKLCDIVSNSLRARQFGCSHGWIERLLVATQDLELIGMREGMIELATALASFSISPRELRRMFRLLCSAPSGQRPALWQQQLEIFTRSSRRAGPQAYFELNGGQEGKEPGIMLPVVRAWPMTSGYSVMAWLRVESFNEPTQRPGTYQPALYYLMNDQEAGIEAHLSKAGMLIGASNGKGRKQNVRVPFNFEERRWYHVCVAHEYRYIRSSEVSLYVDGHLIGTAALAFPKVDVPVTRGCIGNNVPPPAGERTQPLYGQLGRVLIFTEALAKEEVALAFQLGPEVRATPRPGEAAADIGQVMGSFSFGGRRSVKLFAAFHAKAVDGNVVLDTASGQRERHAQRLPGLRPVRTVSLRKSLRAVGGMPLFLPLFLQLDWPLAGAEGEEAAVAASSAADLLRVLQLIAHLTSPGDDALPLQPDIFAHLGLLLRRVSPSSLSVEVVRILDKLAMQLLDSPPHMHALFTHCMLDFELWILAPYATQLELFATLISHARRAPKQMRLLFPVQTLLDVLRDLYWFTPQIDSLGSMPRNHPISGAIVGQRPVATEIRALRALFLQLLHVYTNDDFTAEELRAVCLHIRACPDDEQLPDLLLHLLNLVIASASPANKRAALGEQLYAAGGLPMWVALLWRKSLEVRVLALKLLAGVLPYARLPPARRPGDKVPRDAASAALAAIKAPLESGELTTSVYHALVELLLLQPSGQVERSQHPPPSSTVGAPVFACAAVLPVLFELLAVRASFSVRLAALQDFAALLERSPQNLAVFTDQPHWQSWLLAFLARPVEPALSASLQNAVVRVATHAMHHLVLTPDGHKGFSELHAMVTHFADFFDTAPFMRSLCMALFIDLQRDNRVGALLQKDLRIWENLVAFLTMAEAAFAPVDSTQLSQLSQRLPPQSLSLPEEYFALGITRGEDGAWKDFTAAQSILELLDTVWLSSPATLVKAASQYDVYSGYPNGMPYPPPNVTPAEMENSLFRLALRLTLYSLHETDTFFCSERFQLRKESLESVEELLMGESSQAGEEEGEPRGVPQALSRYISGKMGEWTEELDLVQASFQRSLARLRRLLGRAAEHRTLRTPPASPAGSNSDLALTPAPSSAAMVLLTEMAAKRIVISVAFVFSAMRKSYENRGLGAEGMLALFKELTVLVRGVLPSALANAASPLSPESFYELLITQLSFPESANGSQVNLLPAFADALRSVLDEELTHHVGARSLVQVQRQLVREGLQRGAHEDAEQAERFAVYAKQRQDTDAAEESGRRAAALSHRDKRRVRLEHKWVKLMRSLAHERGSWQNLSVPDLRLDTPYWSLARAEDQTRRRWKLKKNYHGTSHAEAAKANKEPPRQGPVEDELLARLSGIQAPAVVAEASSDAVAVNTAVQVVPVEEDVRSLYETDAELVRPMSVTTGKLQLTKEWLVFVPVALADAPPEGPHHSHPISGQKKWNVSHLRAMYRRRYLLRSSALELFFVDTSSVFFNFAGKTKARDTVARKIVQLSPSSLAEYPDTPNALTALLTAPSPENDFRRSGLLRKWQAREISNFEYLMHLNTLAGRTYNDLTQYPVFPWVIADYTSQVLDLTKAATYRDLTKPIGALNPERLKNFRARYEAFDDPVIPKFLYGSHYSNPGVVLFWLLRLEPFTSHFLTLQGGKFDHAERTFFSVAQAWENCLKNPSDVKELTPEFYYLPDFLRNSSGFDLGTMADGTKISDVILPPWAGGSPERFVSLLREALESVHVSDNLHHWIDLIFGYKQRGDEAVKANNVFFYLTYEGRVDLDKIEDPVQRAAIESQIVNFGQTPARLLSKPHPPRGPPPAQPAKRAVAGGQEPGSYALIAPRNVPAAHLGASPDGRIFAANRDGSYLVCSLLPQPDGRGLPFSFEADKSGKPRQLDFLIGDEVGSAQACFAVLRDGKHILHCGSWDDSFKLASLVTGKPLISLTEHNDVVTCLTVDTTELVLATGSADSTICVWDLPSIVKASSSGFVPAALTNTVTSLLVKEAVSPVKLMHEKQANSTDTSAVAITPIYRLHGHDDTVVCLHANTNLDLLLSGSSDGTVILWNLRRGSYLRSLPVGHPVEHIALSQHALILAASRHVRPRQVVKRMPRSKSTSEFPSAPAPSPPTAKAPAAAAPPPVGAVAKVKAAAHHQRSHSGQAAPAKAEEEYHLTLWTVNGVRLGERTLAHQATALLITADGRHALVGTTGGAVLVLNLSPMHAPLHLLHTYTVDERPPYNTVRSLAFAGSDQYLLVGLESGGVLLLPLHPSDWK